MTGPRRGPDWITAQQLLDLKEAAKQITGFESTVRQLRTNPEIIELTFRLEE